MAEEPVFFMSGTLQIQGLLQTKPGDKGVVITHPHPLYGGSMHNNVVESLVHAYQQAGYATLRFNFRGVGSSQGKYDDGQGEQEDVKISIALPGRAREKCSRSGRLLFRCLGECSRQTGGRYSPSDGDGFTPGGVS